MTAIEPVKRDDIRDAVREGILNHVATEQYTAVDIFTFTDLGKKLYLLLRD